MISPDKSLPNVEEGSVAQQLGSKTKEWWLRVRNLEDLLNNEGLSLLAQWQDIDPQKFESTDAAVDLSTRREWSEKFWRLSQEQWIDGEEQEKVDRVAKTCLDWHQALAVGMSVNLADSLVGSLSRVIWRPAYSAWVVEMQERLGKITSITEKESLEFAQTICDSITSMCLEVNREKAPVQWHSTFIDLHGKWGIQDSIISPAGLVRVRGKNLRYLSSDYLSSTTNLTWRDSIRIYLGNQDMPKIVLANYGVDFISMLNAVWVRQDLRETTPSPSSSAIKSSSCESSLPSTRNRGAL